ncbi:hypothetical protein CH63R_13346 [Colletotrichum higginsianum IMI 349063]|uniref:Uncharacterized protein n=1 Tax=Colletotrichum higginsianum (strain IMI 349063) TaxID=759273 RepID=A0A1B7XWT4_COLHI|nr:hypothetical protein CH63R_13346 [Colletotrichum higginsianum IMI 349063]OBR04219.1 hypothetical protein CH63R_13346 [Colletotrichum higginsianum IMI 349063]
MVEAKQCSRCLVPQSSQSFCLESVDGSRRRKTARPWRETTMTPEIDQHVANQYHQSLTYRQLLIIWHPVSVTWLRDCT